VLTNTHSIRYGSTTNAGTDHKQNDNFKVNGDLQAAVGAIFKQLDRGLRDFVDDRLNAIPSGDDDGRAYRDDPKELPSLLLNGDFAEATPSVSDAFQDSLEQIVGVYIINKLWNDQKVIVAKATQADFGAGANTDRKSKLYETSDETFH
jgi:hypothetical protein